VAADSEGFTGAVSLDSLALVVYTAALLLSLVCLRYGFLTAVYMAVLLGGLGVLLAWLSVYGESRSEGGACLAARACIEKREPSLLSMLRGPLGYAVSAALAIYGVPDILSALIGYPVDRMPGMKRLYLALLVFVFVFLASLLAVTLPAELLHSRSSRLCRLIEEASLNSIAVVSDDASKADTAAETIRYLAYGSGGISRAARRVLIAAVVSVAFPAYLLGLPLAPRVGYWAPVLTFLAGLSVALLARSRLVERLAVMIFPYARGAVYLLPKNPSEAGRVAAPAGDLSRLKDYYLGVADAIRATPPPYAILMDPSLSGVEGYIVGYLLRVTRRGVGVALPVAVYNIGSDGRGLEYVIGPASGAVCGKPQKGSAENYKVCIKCVPLTKPDSIDASRGCIKLEMGGSGGTGKKSLIAGAKDSSEQSEQKEQVEQQCKGRLAVLVQATRQPSRLSPSDIKQLRGYGAQTLLWIRVLPPGGRLRGMDHLVAARVATTLLDNLLSEVNKQDKNVELQLVVPAMSPFTGVALGNLTAVSPPKLVCGYDLVARRYQCLRLRR